jgi:cytochrome b
MKKTLIWDLPIRLFHWGFAGLVTASVVIALTVDDDHPFFQWHMLCGLGAASLLVARVFWGFVGSWPSRFSQLPLRPHEIAKYFAGVASGNALRYPAHNPGAALAAVAMFLLVPALVLTGVGVVSDDLHEPLAYALMGVIVLHLVGIAAHTLRHRENIALSMITGFKQAPTPVQPAPARPLWGLAFVAAAMAWMAGLVTQWDTRTASIRLPGTNIELPLGGKESDNHAKGDRSHRSRDHDND